MYFFNVLSLYFGPNNLGSEEETVLAAGASLIYLFYPNVGVKQEGRGQGETPGANQEGGE